MRINRLSLKNWKGITGAVDLAPVTVFHGPNFTGKSARLEAIRCGLLGYDPALGKRGVDVFRYSSGDECSVAMQFNDGTELKRDWRRVRGSVVAGNVVPFGDKDVPSVLLDPTVYFSLSERERVKMVFQACRIDVDPLTELLGKLDRIPVSEMQRDKLISLKAVLKNAQSRDQTALEDLIEAWTSWRKEADHNAKSAQATSGFVSANIEVPDVSKEEAELVRLRSQIEQLIVDVSRARNDAMQAENDQLRRTRATQELKTNPDRSDEIKKLAKTITDLSNAATPSASSLETVRGKLMELKVRVSSGKEGLQRINSKLNALATETEQVLSAPECPTCGETAGKWKKMYRAKIAGIRNEMALEIRNRETELERMETEFRQLSEQEFAMIQAQAGAKESQQKLRAAISELDRLHAYQERRKQWQAELDSAPMLSVAECDAKMAKIQTEIGDCRAREQSLQDVVNRAVAARGQAALRMQAADKLDRATADLELAKAALAAAQEVKEKLVEQTFGKLLAVANRLAAPVLSAPIAYHENEVGYWRVNVDDKNPTRKQWVSFKTLCGSEQAIVFAAISLALSQESPIKIVLLDECGRLESGRKIKLVNLLKALVADGTIDQAVLADVDGSEYVQNETVKVICTKP